MLALVAANVVVALLQTLLCERRRRSILRCGVVFSLHACGIRGLLTQSPIGTLLELRRQQVRARRRYTVLRLIPGASEFNARGTRPRGYAPGDEPLGCDSRFGLIGG